MSKFFLIALVLAAVCLIFANAAPQILDAQTAIQKIIAAYNHRYPGHSTVHHPEIATLIDPNTYVPNHVHG